MQAGELTFATVAGFLKRTRTLMGRPVWVIPSAMRESYFQSDSHVTTLFQNIFRERGLRHVPLSYSDFHHHRPRSTLFYRDKLWKKTNGLFATSAPATASPINLNISKERFHMPGVYIARNPGPEQKHQHPKHSKQNKRKSQNRT